ncbi:MAG: HPr family phosphocarrier protein [Spirochaetes bacterium]|nr:MAG: HPr family phosphocarrier protein [Spirochaetota bacterium]
MTEKEVVVKSDAGVHARPAMMFVREAMKFPCEVFIVKDEIEANGKSIMSVLGLAITSGTKLIVRAAGQSEADAVASLVALIENDFKN